MSSDPPVYRRRVTDQPDTETGRWFRACLLVDELEDLALQMGADDLADIRHRLARIGQPLRGG
jgi:hypothetical protein